MHYKKLDLIRVVICLTVFMYHLKLLPNGYLAVAVFFILSGYLTFISAYKKDTFTLKEYYYNKLKKLYLPLIITTFITIFITNFIPNLYWFNLKEEVTSILLGYNNFFQISTNINYFSNNVTSPFIHLWYIAILLQYDLIFPFIFIFLQKLKNKYNKLIPLIITTIVTLIFTLYSFKSGTITNMNVYYNTLMRIYLPLLGLNIALIHTYYHPLTLPFFQNKIFYIYIFILINLFISTNLNYTLLTSLITCRLLSYSTINNKVPFEKSLKFISKISYEIYLVHYPIIFIFNYINIPYKTLMILLITILTAYLLHISLNNKSRYIKLLKIIVIILSIMGMYKYITAKSYKKEMNILKQELAKNEIILKENEEKYIEKLKQEQELWSKTLEELNNDFDKLQSVVTFLPLVGIGDSVMLGAIPNIQNKFPNSYFDARVSRTAWEVKPILEKLKNNNLLGNPIVINLGTNGDCTKECKNEIMNELKDKKVFWINTVNYQNVNEELLKLQNEHDNLTIIDWYTASKGKNDYFIYDGIHLTEIGKNAYANLIYNEIYQNYLEEYQKRKQEIINNYEENLKNKITFYGNDMLLNLFPYLQKSFQDSKFIINNSYEELKENITNSIKDKSLTNNIILILDKTINLKEQELKNIISLCENNNIYIITTNNINIVKPNVKIIDLSKEINSYLMVDGIHLSNEGNTKISEIIEKMIE